MKRYLILLFVIPTICAGQFTADNYPKDTSFNVKAAARQIARDFPNATTVEEFEIPSIKSDRDVPYHNLGYRELHIDVFYPKLKKDHKHPAVLLIHGGGWASGTKSHMIPLAQKLAEHGYVAACVEYRLSPEAKYPAGMIDLKTAVKWLKINAPNYAIDTSKIAVLGTSSGATQASLLGTTSDKSIYQSHPVSQPVSDKVQAIINIDGVVDFTHPAESGKDSNPDKPSAGARWFGYTYQQKPELWVEASPISYVDSTTPPTIFINSALDRFHAGRDPFIQVLKENNIYYEIHKVDNTPHPFWLFHPWFDEMTPHLIHFLDTIFL